MQMFKVVPWHLKIHIYGNNHRFYCKKKRERSEIGMFKIVLKTHTNDYYNVDLCF